MENPRTAADGDAGAPQAGDEHARRAASFGAAASAYGQHRPDYPVTAVRWALEPAAALASGRPLRICDLGAGTGKLTAQLASLVIDGSRPEVVAVEPDPSMLAELRRYLPAARATPGRAEAIPLRDGSVDAVLAGQAAHWFDLDRAMPEIARVLAPGGVFAGLWNADDDRVGWVAGLHRVSGSSIATLSAFTQSDDDEITQWLGTAGSGLFLRPEVRGFEHTQVRTADSLVETMRTHSMFLIMEPAECDAALARVRDYLAATPQTAAGEFVLPLCTFALRTVRR